jgi:hypothetical protein
MDIIGCVWVGYGWAIHFNDSKQATDVVEDNSPVFSFFTILTNILVALYFSSRITKHGNIFTIAVKAHCRFGNLF